MINSYQGQIRGPFNNQIDLLNEIITELGLSQGNYIIVKLGIQADEGTQFYLNNDSEKIFRVGKTKIYEIEDVEITGLVFLVNGDESFIIDYILKEV